jgi:flagellar protein FlbD
MIRVTRFDGSQLYVNADLIEFIESTPDTVLSLTSNRKVVVRETADAVVEQVIAYRHRVHSGPTVLNPIIPLPVRT